MPALPQLYPYKAGPIEPIVMPGEIVGVWVNKVFNFFRVDYIEGFPRSEPLEIDLGAVALQGQSAITQLGLLEMPDTEFGQFRAEVLDDISGILFQGRADQRHKLFTRVATYTRFGAIKDPDGHEGEFYVHENNWAFMQAQNQTDYALTQSRIAFWGFRYVLDPLTEYSWKTKTLPPAWTRVPATAHL